MRVASPWPPPSSMLCCRRAWNAQKGGRPKGIYFASPLTNVLLNIESRGGQGGIDARRSDDQERWVGAVSHRLELAKFLPSSCESALRTETEIKYSPESGAPCTKNVSTSRPV